MTSISRGDGVRPYLAYAAAAAARLARSLLDAAARRWVERAARRDLADRPAWMLRDIGLTHGDVADAVSGRRSDR